MRDQGIPYTFITNRGTFVLNPNGFQGDGLFMFDQPDAAERSESDVSARGFSDGSVIGQTRIGGLQYGLTAYAMASDPQDREDLEDVLCGYVDSMRRIDGEIQWNSKGDGSLRVIRNVRTTAIPRPTDRIGVNKKYDFEIAAVRPYAEGVEVQTDGSPLDTSGGGLVFPSAFPWIFDSTGGGDITVPNPGKMDEKPLLRIVGPTSGPVLTRIDTQESIILDGLIIADGEYVDVDLFFRTIYLNGSINVRGALRPVQSAFFSIPPGGTIVKLTGADFTSATQLIAFTRGAYPA